MSEALHHEAAMQEIVRIVRRSRTMTCAEGNAIIDQVLRMDYCAKRMERDEDIAGPIYDRRQSWFRRVMG